MADLMQGYQRLDPIYDGATGLGGYGAGVDLPALTMPRAKGDPYGGVGGAVTGIAAGLALPRSGSGRLMATGPAMMAGNWIGSLFDDPGQGMPHIPRQRAEPREYMDDGQGVVPPLRYPTAPPADARASGLMSGLYQPLDTVTNATGQALSEATAYADQHGRQSPVGSLLGKLMGYGVQGLLETPGSALKVASAPVDAVQGRRVDAGLGDAANVALAGAGGAWHGMRALRRKWLEDEVAGWNSYMHAGLPKAPTSSEVYAGFKGSAETDPLVAKAYRGSESGKMRFSTEGSRGPWASDDPRVAGTYAKEYGSSPSMAPLEFRFQNPFVVDAQGAHYGSIPIPGGQYRTSTDAISEAAKTAGHDGVVFKNVYDSAHGGNIPSTVYNALKRGTTYSPLTGELLYGLAPPTAALGYLSAEDLMSSSTSPGPRTR